MDENKNYSTTYYLYLIEELFKYAGGLFIIVFGAIYYYINYVVAAPNFKNAITLFIFLSTIFGFFYILFPVKRKLFSNLELFKPSYDFSSFQKKHEEKIFSYLFACNITPASAPFISLKSDYYVTLPVWFFLMVFGLTMELCVYEFLPSFFYGNDFIFAAKAFYVVCAAAIAVGFRHYNNIFSSTHYWFLLLFILLFSLQTILVMAKLLGLSKIAYCLALNIFFILLFFYYSYRKRYLIVFVRDDKRNIHKLVINDYDAAIIEFEKIEFDVNVKFVQTPYAFCFMLYDGFSDEIIGGPFYLGVSNERISRIVEIFCDRTGIIVKRNGEANESLGYFKPLDISVFSSRFGLSQLIITLSLNLSLIFILYKYFGL